MQKTYSQNLIVQKSDQLFNREMNAEWRGQIQYLTLSQNPEIEYYLYIPPSGGKHNPLMIIVHGITRNAKEQIELFAPYADQFDCILISPYFNGNLFKGFQRLGFNGKGERADQALIDIVDEVEDTTGVDSNPMVMFGFSGGAQFVHRFAMVYPAKVARMALGASGWYTFPDLTCEYPLGIKRIRNHHSVHFDLLRILSIPACVVVGELDNGRDEQLRKSRKIDHLQGIDRIERGKRWIKTMSAASRALSLSTDYEFHLLRNAAHSFQECVEQGSMGELVFRFLFQHGKKN